LFLLFSMIKKYVNTLKASELLLNLIARYYVNVIKLAQE